MTIGLYGFGFLNRAIEHAFGNNNNILYYSLDEKNCDLDGLVKSDFIFMALPTPMRLKDGSCDLSIIESSLDELAKRKYRGIIIIKSTIPPGSCEKWVKKFRLKIVFSPEFLTERSAKLDFINSSRHILGGKKKDMDKVEKLLRTRFVATPIFKTNFRTAEFIKYMCNCFFTTKVIYMNIMYQIAKKCGLDYDLALKGFLTDYRIGNSHYQVPGPDGKLGFSGSCFPKDLNAFIYWLKSIGMKDEAKFFEIIWKLNLKYRPEKDWETLKGRVIS
jgi:UDPglucose 6-dehydrogenase